jgi:hypothetical protein
MTATTQLTAHRFYPAQEIAQMRGGKETGKGEYQCKCPTHDDRVASLSVGTGRNGDTLIDCKAGCDRRDVVRALGLEWRNLFREPRSNSQSSPYRPPPATPKQVKPSRPEDLSHPTLGKPDAVYPYVNASGVLTYATARFSKPEKSFRQAQPDGNGRWQWNLGGIEPIPYRLPELIEAVSEERLIWIPEGERDVERLVSLGLPATCNSGGAEKFPASAAKYFAGAHVAIIPDNDPPGRNHAEAVAALLQPVAASVKVVALPDVPEKGDVSDWIDAGHTVDALRERTERAVLWRADRIVNAAEPDGRVFVSLAELLQRPELLKPPLAVIPRLGHQGRTTLLAAPDKSGKSTLAAHAAAEATKRGVFLSETIGATTARVVWAGLEEAVGDTVMRFHVLGAVPENIKMVVLHSPKLLEDIHALLEEWPADLLVLDSLTEYARVVKGTVPDDGDTSGWASVIRPLVHLTREFPVLSSILLHHPRRSDGQFRGSGEIAAAVDCLLEMRLPEKNEDPTVRHITGRARWQIQPFDVRFSDGRYELAGGAQLSLDARILIHIEQKRGVSMSELRGLVGGRGKAVDEAVDELLRRGAIIDTGMKGKHAYHPAAGKQEAFGLST